MLHGDSIVLGPIVQSDAQPLFRWLNDPFIARTNGGLKPMDGVSFTNWFNGLGKDRARLYFAVRAKGDARLVGYVTILDIHPVFRSAELGITVGDASDRGKGIGTEAVRLAMEYCWRQLDLERLGLRIYGQNEAASRCYRKAGFVHEGVLRQAAFLDGERIDVILMGALRPREGKL